MANLQEMPGDVISHIALHLPLCDVASFCIINQHFGNMLHSNHHLWISLVDNLLKFHLFNDLSVTSYLHAVYESVQDMDLFYAFLKMLSARIPPYPTSIDMRIFDWHRGPKYITPLDADIFNSSIVAVTFTGLLGESARSVVANNPFPYLRFDSRDEKFSFVPFSRVGTIQTKSTAPAKLLGFASLSFTAYFECRIFDVLNTESVGGEQPFELVSQRKVIRVGLACPPFSLNGQLPGSDNFSFGYHSVDGCFYLEGREGMHFGGEPFGPGDVVGCGILYGGNKCPPNGKIFFTKNGVLQGAMLDVANPTFLCLSWFPAVVSVFLYIWHDINIFPCRA